MQKPNADIRGASLPGDLAGKTRRWLLLAAAGLMVVMTAFELREPLFSLGTVDFTSSEVAAGLFLVMVVVWGAGQWRELYGRRALDVAVLLFLATNFFAALFSADPAMSLKYCLRMTYAALVYFGVSRLPARAPSHMVIMGAAAFSLVVVTAAGLLEALVTAVRWDEVFAPFRDHAATFGFYQHVRIASTLPFPTVLSAYLEMGLPLAVGFILSLASGWKGWRRWLAMLSVPVLMAAVIAAEIFSFTRTGYVIIPASFLLGALAAIRWGYGRRVWLLMLMAPVLFAVLLGASALLTEKVAVRLGLAEQSARHGAEYRLLEAPAQLRLATEPEALLEVRNTGNFTWRTDGRDAVNLSYRWVGYPDGREREFGYTINEFAADIAPGETALISIPFRTPDQPGRYILIFDLVHERIAWFSAAGAPGLMLPYEFDGDGSGQPLVLDQETLSRYSAGEPVAQAISRFALWKAAAAAWRDNPMVGLGPDQFRLRYTEFADLKRDERMRAHNLFLEALANTGLLGFTALVYLVGRSLWVQLRLLRSRAGETSLRLAALAVFVSLAAFLAHSMLEYFLWQTGIAFLLFTVLGLTSWLDKCRQDAAGDAK